MKTTRFQAEYLGSTSHHDTEEQAVAWVEAMMGKCHLGEWYIWIDTDGVESLRACVYDTADTDSIDNAATTETCIIEVEVEVTIDVVKTFNIDNRGGSAEVEVTIGGGNPIVGVVALWFDEANSDAPMEAWCERSLTHLPRDVLDAIKSMVSVSMLRYS